MADVLDINDSVDLDVEDEGDRKFSYSFGIVILRLCF